MIDHLTLTVRDIAQNKHFYTQALAPLGYSVQMEYEQSYAFGEKGKPSFWLKPGETPTPPMHIAFVAKERPAVDAFHAAALAAGATDNGAPGLRPHYHPNYYGAFVIDPNGHPIEAVCHAAPRSARQPPKARKAPPVARTSRPVKRAKARPATGRQKRRARR